MTQWNKNISAPKSWTRSVVKFVHRSVNKIMWITSIQTKKQPQALISNVQNQSWTESKLLPHKPWTSNPTLEGCCEGGIYIISSGSRINHNALVPFSVHALFISMYLVIQVAFLVFRSILICVSFCVCSGNFPNSVHLNTKHILVHEATVLTQTC